MIRAPMMACHGTSGIAAHVSRGSFDAASPICPMTASAPYWSTGSWSKAVRPRRTISSPTPIAARMSSRSLSTGRGMRSNRDGVGEDVIVLWAERGGFDEVDVNTEDVLELDQETGQLE